MNSENFSIRNEGNFFGASSVPGKLCGEHEFPTLGRTYGSDKTSARASNPKKNPQKGQATFITFPLDPCALFFQTKIHAPSIIPLEWQIPKKHGLFSKGCPCQGFQEDWLMALFIKLLIAVMASMKSFIRNSIKNCLSN